MIKAYAVHQAGGKLKPFAYDLGELKPEQVEIDVEYCGICHSDLSMIDNDWDMSNYPLVPGHEAIGKIAKVAREIKTLKIGQRVSLGWFSTSCMYCEWCMSGDQNLCLSAEETIVGRHGASADKVRSHHGKAIANLANSFDVILSTVNVDLNWNSYVDALRPRGTLHFVGAVPNPISTPVFPLI